MSSKKRISVYKGDDTTGELVGYIQESIYEDDPSFKPGQNELTLSFKNEINIEPGQKYTIHFAPKMIAASTLNMNMTDPMPEVTYSFYGAALEEFGITEASPSNPSTLESLGEFALTFNGDIDLAEGAKASLYEGETLVKDASLYIDENNGAVAKADFGGEPLYKKQTYKVVVAENSAFPKGQTEGGNSSYTAIYTGDSYRPLVATVTPAEGSTIGSLKDIDINPQFPRGYGFVSDGTEHVYAAKLYKGGKDGEFVEDLELGLNASAHIEISGPSVTLQSNSTYTVVVPEGQIIPYEMGVSNPKAAEEYYQFEWAFTWKTAAAPVNVLGSSITADAALPSLGLAAFYVSGATTVADGAVMKLMKGETPVKEAAVTLAATSGNILAMADFSDASHAPQALEDNTAYTLVLPQGSLTGEDGIVTNAEKAVAFTGLIPVVIPEPEYAAVSLAIDGRASSSATTVKGEPYTLTVKSEDADWTVESLTLNGTDVTADISDDGAYTIAEVTGDAAFVLTMAYAGELTVADINTGIAQVEGTDIRVYSENGEIVVEGLKQGDNIRVYTVGGMLLKSHVATEDSVRISAPNGTYIVRVNSHAVKIVH